MSKGSRAGLAADDFTEDIAGDAVDFDSADVDIPDADELNGDEEEEDGDDTGGSEVYVVETIKDHALFEDGKVKYKVKWKGYEKEEDETWEGEEQFIGARPVLETYWKKIGGKPDPDTKKPASSKKRARASTGETPKSTPKAKAEPKPPPKRQRKSVGRKSKDEELEGSDEDEDGGTPEPVPGYTEVGSDDWRPPKPAAGVWDKEIQAIDTIEKDEGGNLWAYLLWVHQNADGYFYRNKAKLETCYVACPQRMLQFYEKHVVFTKYRPS